MFARADVYASELEKRLRDLREAENALARAKGSERLSEDKFQNVFRSSPVPFSTITFQERRFVDVNAAFERRYGYSRDEVLGHTAQDLRVWAEPEDRVMMIERPRRGMPIRNIITRLRTKSGEVKLTACSADKIHSEGQPCILAVSEDIPEFDRKSAN